MHFNFFTHSIPQNRFYHMAKIHSRNNISNYRHKQRTPKNKKMDSSQLQKGTIKCLLHHFSWIGQQRIHMECPGGTSSNRCSSCIPCSVSVPIWCSLQQRNSIPQYTKNHQHHRRWWSQKRLSLSCKKIFWKTKHRHRLWISCRKQWTERWSSLFWLGHPLWPSTRHSIYLHITSSAGY